MLELWADGVKWLEPLPLTPYFYSKTRRDGIDHVEHTIETVRYISDHGEHIVHKYGFGSVKDVPVYRDADSMECDVPYLQRVAIDDESYYLGYPQRQNPKVLYFDIEVRTAGRFPDSAADRIIGIGYCLGDGEVKLLTLAPGEEDDSRILAEFMAAIDALDPDVLCGYYSDVFDLPYILDRLEIAGVPSKPLTRDADAKEAWFRTDDGERKLYIKGRAVLDLFDEVRIDQTLSGILSRKMKDVAKWYGVADKVRRLPGYADYEVVVEDVSDTANMPHERLKKYLESDILITRELGRIYLPNLVQLADLLMVPLNVIAKRSASLVGTLVYARELKRLGIISDAPNWVRHPDIFGRPVKVVRKGREETEFVGGTSFQGAIVSMEDVYAKKVLRPVRKVDFAGLYPAVMRNFNLSPETVRFKEAREYDASVFRIETGKDSYEFEFPDNRLNVNIVLTISAAEGFVPRSMKIYGRERSLIKKQLKDCDDSVRQELTSKSWVYKILGNSSYGVNASALFRYGSVWVAAATTAVARHLITFVAKEIGDSVVECDTDGIFMHGSQFDGEALTASVNRMMLERYGMPTDFVIEQDDYEAGFFVRMKNYALLDGKGRLVKHGVSMKSSSKNAVLRLAIDRILLALLRGEDVESVCFDCYDHIDDAQLHEFLQSTRINMALEAYANQGCLQVRVGRQSARYHGSAPRIGDQLAYVKTDAGYRIRETLDGTGRIDKAYYRAQLLKLLERFGLDAIKWKLENRHQTVLAQYW